MTLIKIIPACLVVCGLASASSAASDTLTSATADRSTTGSAASTHRIDAPSSPTVAAEPTTSQTQTLDRLTTTAAQAVASDSGTTTSASKTQRRDRATTHTARPRFTSDDVKPGDDATSQPFDAVTAVSENPERDARLAGAVVADDFRESTSPDFVHYQKLVPGNRSDTQAGKTYVSTHSTFPHTFARQPIGPLTGRIIYAAGGHGWTNDNTSTTLWYTQRPSTHGIVEDLGNLDQMNLYADLCFRAGATVVPMRPVGFQHVERVIDNDSSHAFFYGSWADSQSTSSFGFAGAQIPYRFARASGQETAVARFRPVIPVTDEYPVYAWARAGADRVKQTYRVVHAGGVTEIDVDHRRVGNGWVYLGSYPFSAGDSGYVEITDKVRDAKDAAAGGVVIADAIRFGNGMGDVNRGGGISGKPREEESSRYWVERSLPAGAPPIFHAFENANDQSDNVGAAPRFAAFMNREAEGGFFDRLYLSFHSNASGGRGVVGLFNSHARMRPDHQIELAKLVADELNSEMTSAGLELSQPWYVRPVRTDAHINFGEIRRDYLNNEMSATISEVAFHDNAQDAELLRQLSIRRGMALSAYRATLRFFREVGGANINYFAPPNPPTLLSALAGPTSGTLDLQWTPAEQDKLSSQSSEMTYRIYTSEDGAAFDEGRDAGASTHFQLTKLPNNSPIYVRVTAVSPGGESLPSGVLGASLGSGRKVLVAQGAPLPQDDDVLTETATRDLGHATGKGGKFARLVPRLMNNGEQVRAVGDGAQRLKIPFESVDISQMKAATDATSYSAIAIMLGRRIVPEQLTTTSTLEMLHDFVSTGGKLLISGGRLAEADPPTTEALSRWGKFAENVLQVSFADQTSQTEILKAGDHNLTTVTLRLGDRNLRYFEPRPTEVLLPETAGRAVLAYQGAPGAAAIATLMDGKLCTTAIGFPLEELARRQEQSVLVGQIFLGMGLKAPAPAKAKTTITPSSKKSAAAKKETAKPKKKNTDAKTSKQSGKKAAKSKS